MNRKEYNIADNLPESLNRENLQQVANLIDEKMHELDQMSELVSLYPRIDELSSNLINELAIQLHVDFYDTTFSLGKRRALVKNSVLWHMKKGTPAAVIGVISAAFDNASIEEWFQYGGNPYTFRLTTSGFTDKDSYNQIIKAINATKNTRSHLDSITAETDAQLNLYTGSVMHLQSTRHLTIAPLPDTAVQRIYIGFGQRFGGHERITPAVLERESMDIAIGLRLGYHGLHKVNAEYTEPPTIQNMLVDMPIITGALLFRGGQQSIHIRMPTAENTGYNTGLAIRHSGATSIAPAMHSIVDSGLMVGCFLRGAIAGKISCRKEDMNE